MQFFSLVTMVLVVNGCMFESSPDEVADSGMAGNHPPIIREAEVEPNPIVLSGPVSVLITTEDHERDAVSYHYQWAINGSPIAGQTHSTLPPDILKRGDTVSVTVVPDDGKTRGDAHHTKIVPVINTPPRIVSLSLEPQSIKPGDVIKVQVEATDPDLDRIELSYRWWRNGTAINEWEESEIVTAGFSPEDVVVVEVTPRDATAQGKTIKSDPVSIGLVLPTIVSVPPTKTSHDRFEYVVKAVSSHGELLRYRLESAPSGMVIDAATGHITWQVPAQANGIHKVRVVADNGKGGTAYQEFEISIPAEKA
jgi:translation initiation factor IF-1